MCSRLSLREWIAALLPNSGPCARVAAHDLLRSLLVEFTTELNQLARQADHVVTAKITRQYFNRWLNRPHWQPEEIYSQLNRLARRWLRSQKQVLLLIDTTDLKNRWVVLQVSVPWERRALPVLRLEYPYSGAERDQVSALARALEWLKENLPGPRSRYVLVMDRGFPSNPLITHLQQEGWRFVLRVKSNWRMEHRAFTGQMRRAIAAQLTQLEPRLFRKARLGAATHCNSQRSWANVVHFFGEGHQEPWFLVTSEGRAATAVAIYRERMRIEQEFRDLKGPLGLDRLAAWQDRDRVARFLAWVAAYEWRLAYLWIIHQLKEFAAHLRINGELSWIRVVREWIAREIRLAAGLAPGCL
jgi:hypothetical protein